MRAVECSECVGHPLCVCADTYVTSASAFLFSVFLCFLLQLGGGTGDDICCAIDGQQE